MQTSFNCAILIRSLFLCTFFSITAPAQVLPEIQVSNNHKFLKTSNGKPFFWLADTDWELFHRMDRQETESFLETRRKQGFNIIQAVALAEFDGIKSPNRYGDFPLVNEDPTQLAITPGIDSSNKDQYDYWDHVDFVFKTATAKGLYIGLLPTWGDKLTRDWGDGPVIFNTENAMIYGRILGKRYGKYNVIWILGGDRPAVYEGRKENKGKQFDDRPIWRAMAQGIAEGVGHDPFITYHPAGATSSSKFLHNETWLDMNTFQSGHGARETESWTFVTKDLALDPQKPTLDMEPCYEDHPVNPWDGKWTKQRGYFSAYDVRARIYRSIFAGAAGVTYGHHQIWQFLNKDLYAPINIGDTLIGWQKAANAEGANQMQFLKKLMLSRPYDSRIPDQSLIISANTNSYVDRIEATRDSNGSYAMIYLPQNQPVNIDLNILSGKQIQAWWYDPRNGKAIDGGVLTKTTKQPFTPPKDGKDWILVLDDVEKKYKSPGNP